MEKIEITLAFDGEKLDALEYALRKERTTVQKQMDEALRQLYETKVPEAVRDYLDNKNKPTPPNGRPGIPKLPILLRRNGIWRYRRMGTIETDRFESVNSPPWISGMVAFAKRGILFLIAFGEGIFQGTRGIVCLSQVERNKRRITKWISREAENYRSGSVWTR